jgi:hypothetical protein
MVMKSSIFWDITLRSPLEAHQRSGGTFSLHLYGQRITLVSNQREVSHACCVFQSCFLLRLLFDPEGGVMFLRNVGLSPDDTVIRSIFSLFTDYMYRSHFDDFQPVRFQCSLTSKSLKFHEAVFKTINPQKTRWVIILYTSLLKPFSTNNSCLL